MKDKVWQNRTLSFHSTYEAVNNVFLTFNVDYSDIAGFTPTDPKGPGEYRTNAQGYLDMYTPLFLQGKKFTVTFGVNIGL
jgi:hypothetical protein